jgi:hypothetical protein
MRSGTYVATSAVVLQLSYTSATGAQTLAWQRLWQKPLAESSVAAVAAARGTS